MRFLVDYIITPGLTWSAAAYGALDWVGRSSEIGRSIIGGAVLLLIIFAYAYQTGLKAYYRAGRRRYYFTVFIAPIILGLGGLLTGIILYM